MPHAASNHITATKHHVTLAPCTMLCIFAGVSKAQLGFKAIDKLNQNGTDSVCHPRSQSRSSLACRQACLQLMPIVGDKTLLQQASLPNLDPKWHTQVVGSSRLLQQGTVLLVEARMRCTQRHVQQQIDAARGRPAGTRARDMGDIAHASLNTPQVDAARGKPAYTVLTMHRTLNQNLCRKW